MSEDAVQDSKPARPELRYRQASAADVAEITRARSTDPASEPGDSRLAAYVQGTHHPQHALALRAVYVAVSGRSVVGYIAGHLTRRHACEGEVQYLWVAPQHRRQGIATELLSQLGGWFAAQRARKVCVNVAEDNVGAQLFFKGRGAGNLERHWLVWADIRGAA